MVGAFLLYLIFKGMNFIRKIMNKTTSGPYWVMYDSKCGFCYRVTRFFKFFDMFDKIQWVDKDWTGYFPDEGRAKIEETVVVFNPSNNKVYYKSRAVSKIILCIPFGFLFFWILLIPVLSIFFDWLYDRVSENRMKFCARKD